VNYYDPYGLELYGAASAGFIGITYSASTQNPSQATITTGDGVIVGGSLSIGWDFGQGAMGENGRELFGDTSVNLGLGTYLGLSFTPDLSKWQLNIGLGLALPASVKVPLLDDNCDLVDGTFGDDLYDILH
jgi:hypothetical protein